MLPIAKKFIGVIICVVMAIFLCILCFSVGRCTNNNRNQQLTETINNLKSTNTELNERYTELKSYVGKAEKELGKLRDYQLSNETDIRKYKETIREYAEIISRIETNKTEAGRTIEQALQTVERIKELISTKNGD